MQLHSRGLIGMTKWWDSTCSCSMGRNRYRLFRKDNTGMIGQEGGKGALQFL